MRRRKGEATQREIETPGETRFSETRGLIHAVPNQEGMPRKLNPANANNIVAGIVLAHRGADLRLTSARAESDLGLWFPLLSLGGTSHDPVV